MANLNFDASKIETNSYQPLPDGWYPVAIVEADMVRTRDGATEYLKLCYEVTGQEYTGRKVFDGLNINHANQTPREIAQRNLASICKAINQLQVASTDQLLGAALMVKLKAEPANERFDARNRVVGYKPTTQTAAPVAAPAAAPKKAPWQR
jgi:hypothetical protein